MTFANPIPVTLELVKTPLMDFLSVIVSLVGLGGRVMYVSVNTFFIPRKRQASTQNADIPLKMLKSRCAVDLVADLINPHRELFIISGAELLYMY